MSTRYLIILVVVSITLHGARALAQSPLAPEPTAEPTPRVGPFVLRDGAGNIWLPTFLIQNVSSASLSQGSGAEVDVLDFRRIRTGLDVTGAGDRLHMDLVWNLAPGSAQLIDAVVALEISPWLVLTAGQFKTPWSRYRLSSGGNQVLVDWSQTTQYFGGERQRGVSIGRAEDDVGGLYYSVGAFVGGNARSSHGVGVALVYGQPLVNVSSFDASGESTLHPELVGHVGWGSAGMDASTLDDRDGGGVRAYVGAGIAHDFRPVLKYDASARQSLEVMLKWRGLSGYLGGYLMWVHLTNEPRVVRGVQGALVELTYRAGRFTSLGFRLSHLTISPDLEADAALVRAAEGLDAELDVAKDELSVGARFDLYGPSLQLMTDVGVARDERHDGQVRTGGTARVQLQLRF